MSKQNNSETETGTAETATGQQQSETQSQATPTKTIKELQAELNSANERISALNKESTGRRKELEAFEAEKREREEAEKSASELLSQRNTELEQLTEAQEEAAGRLETLEGVLEEQYAATIKALSVPDYVQEAIKDRSVSDRLTYLNNHRDQFGSSGRGLDLSGGKDGRTKGATSIEDMKGMTPDQINKEWEHLKKSS